ncbi:MAG: DUF1648 domain-containing protein [Bacteroidetes bacterium]|nr:DUF1648 domain-containing protein [Bacteroidota bacterium]
MIITKFKQRYHEPDRPKIRPELTPVDWLIECLAIFAILSFIGYSIYWFPRVPQIIPIHFNAKGEVNDYGNKASILIFPIIALFTYALLTVIALFPYNFNFAGKITPENAPRQYRLATRFIRILKTVIIFIFFYISAMIIRTAMNKTDRIGIWDIPVILCAIFIPLIVYFVVASRKQKLH